MYTVSIRLIFVHHKIKDKISKDIEKESSFELKFVLKIN